MRNILNNLMHSQKEELLVFVVHGEHRARCGAGGRSGLDGG